MYFILFSQPNKKIIYNYVRWVRIVQFQDFFFIYFFVCTIWTQLYFYQLLWLLLLMNVVMVCILYQVLCCTTTSTNGQLSSWEILATTKTQTGFTGSLNAEDNLYEFFFCPLMKSLLPDVLVSVIFRRLCFYGSASSTMY